MSISCQLDIVQNEVEAVCCDIDCNQLLFGKYDIMIVQKKERRHFLMISL